MYPRIPISVSYQYDDGGEICLSLPENSIGTPPISVTASPPTLLRETLTISYLSQCTMKQSCYDLFILSKMFVAMLWRAMKVS